MAKLELEVVGYHEALDTMTINGEKCEFKFENSMRKYYMESDSAEIVIFNPHHYMGKNWFWWSLLFYIISFFGIFDSLSNQRCRVIDCRFNVKLDKDKKVRLTIKDFEDEKEFALIESEEGVEITNNAQYFDKVGQKRHKKMKGAKFAISFLTILFVTAICVLVLRNKN